MAEEVNPFAPPQAVTAVDLLSGTVWRDGGGLVISPWKATWPARCVCCNAPALSMQKVSITHYPKWVILLFLLSRLLGIVAYFVTRKVATLHVGLCEEHRARRRNRVLVLVGLLVGAFFVVAIGIGSEDPDFAVGGILGGALLAIGGALWAAVMLPVLRIKMVEPTRVFIQADARFVESLPDA